jgi:hypothetical protein
VRFARLACLPRESASAASGRKDRKVKKQLSFLLRNKFLAENVALSGIRLDQEAIIAAMSTRDFDTAQPLIPDEVSRDRLCRDHGRRHQMGARPAPYWVRRNVESYRRASDCVQ